MAGAGLKDVYANDMSNLQADFFVMLKNPLEKTEDNIEEDAKKDVLVHYEMSYLISPEEDDYRSKTIMNGRMSLNMVGTKHRDNYEKLHDRLKIGTPVILKPEPTNPVDPNALAFYLEDGTLAGYLPKKDQPFAKVFMAHGEIKAKVRSFDTKWIETETLLTSDMVDYKAYHESDIEITKIESDGKGGQTLGCIDLKKLVETL